MKKRQNFLNRIMTTDVKVFNEKVTDVLPASVKTEKLAWGFTFTEGPLWHSHGFLLFSDTPANKIFKLSADGKVSVYLDNSGGENPDESMLSDMIGSNGIAQDNHGGIVFCQHGEHAIARLNKNNELSVVTDTYNRRPFNSPNDLIMKKDGCIYFTDPPYGLKDQVLWPDRFQPLGGVYCYRKPKTMLVSTDFRFPNGICLTKDEKHLFVSSNHPSEPYVRKYEVGPDNKLHNGKVFIAQNADGIKLDDKGNLYLATNDGVMVVSPEGEKMALIPLPETPSNLAFGGTDKTTLFITARTSVYMLQLSE
jgi:gluconolactonase